VDIYDAAQYFDKLTATDAYSSATLFTCQLDQYDSTERDSLTSWRRSCSAPVITVPTRRAVAIGGQVYIVGRCVKDFFDEYVIREHAVLHPSDGLFTLGSAKEFLEEYAQIYQLYGAQSLRKEQREEGVSSQVFNVYNVYIGLTESAARDQILLSPSGVYFRVLNVETQSGEYKTLYVAELGASALLPVTYVASSGVYDSVTDSSGAEAPVYIDAFVERYQSNYRYMTQAATKFQDGDKVLTINAEAVATPKSNDRVQVSSIDYKVLAVQSDGAGSWELLIRPAAMNLGIET